VIRTRGTEFGNRMQRPYIFQFPTAKRDEDPLFLKVDFGGVVDSISTHEGQRGFGPVTIRSLPLPRQFHQSANFWEGSRRLRRRSCHHACSVVQVIDAAQQRHFQAVLDFARDRASISKSYPSHISRGVEECDLHMLYAGVNAARCFTSIREVENSPSLSQLVLGPSSQKEDVQKFANEIISLTGRSRHAVLNTAYQVLHTLRQINNPQWSVIYETLSRIISRESKIVVLRVLAQRPPGTGKITTIVKLFCCYTTTHRGTVIHPRCRSSVCHRSEHWYAQP
jgi:hypothetical protein